MSRRSERTLQGIPTKPYDLLREGIVVLAVAAAAVVALAAVFGAPDYPPVNAAEVASRQPIAFLTTAATLLSGASDLQHYGPPYTPDPASAQRVLGLAPAALFGVTEPVDASRDLIVKPLERVATVDPALRAPLQRYRRATASQRQAWAAAYLAALPSATVQGTAVTVPSGSAGPVPALMNAMLALGRSGMLEAALDTSSQAPFGSDHTRSLLFFQGSVDHAVAHSLNMLGEDWGIGHETGAYPGAWWLWPYTFLYQVPPMARSPNGDLQVVLLVLVFLVLLPTLAPFVPGVRDLPRRLPFHRWVWRRWYRRRAP